MAENNVSFSASHIATTHQSIFVIAMQHVSHIILVISQSTFLTLYLQQIELAAVVNILYRTFI